VSYYTSDTTQREDSQQLPSICSTVYTNKHRVLEFIVYNLQVLSFINLILQI